MSTPSTRRSTLQLTWPVGLVPLQSAATLLILALIGEALAHIQPIQSILLSPRISGDYQLGEKLLDLDRQVAAHGPPGCILIGSSMVLRGIDPDVLSQAYQGAFHQPFWCFNFGLAGADAQAAGRLAAILVREYHPRLLIYGTHFRDFIPYGNSLVIPWTDYYLGAPTLDGWLEAHSYLFRYALAYKAQSDGDIPGGRFTIAAIRPNGFSPVARRSRAVRGAVIDTSQDSGFADYAQMSQSYEVDPAALAGLDQLAALNSPQVRVIAVEMPAPDGRYDALPSGAQTRQAFLDALHAHLDPAGVPVWQPDSVNIPLAGWWDLVHLNSTGAEQFSEWLGARLVSAIQDGRLAGLAR